ncbi:hypothetical protein KQX54_004039 [Cotesia glomerata]|uniref:Uncharacterized protein n=1 Tax=Cotesia glomerata TaxID=32391 RepID=A0AAV7HGS7_COTGL|nr:hypothetical protein KQX54_004039 [Cotesia glomerata]
MLSKNPRTALAVALYIDSCSISSISWPSDSPIRKASKARVNMHSIRATGVFRAKIDPIEHFGTRVAAPVSTPEHLFLCTGENPDKPPCEPRRRQRTRKDVTRKIRRGEPFGYLRHVLTSGADASIRHILFVSPRKQ